MGFTTIFGKEKQLLYLTRSGFVIYLDKFPAGIQFDFPPNIVDDEEVVNQEILQKEIESFISKNQIKPGKLIIMLSLELLFEKTFSSTEQKALDSEIDFFLAEIPFKNVAEKILISDKQAHVIATNKDLYQTIKTIFTKKGWTVEAVVPASVFKDLGKKEAIDAKGFRQIVSRKKLISQANLLLKSKKTPLKFFNLIKNRSVKIIVVLLFASLPTVFFIFTVARYMKLSNEATTPQPTVALATQTPTVTVSATPRISPTTQESTSSADLLAIKKSLHIQILNGSGVAGAASQAAEILKNGGFENLDVGNASSFDHLDTTIYLKEDIPDHVFDLIAELLRAYRVKIADSALTDEDYELVIIIGERIQ